MIFYSSIKITIITIYMYVFLGYKYESRIVSRNRKVYTPYRIV